MAEKFDFSLLSPTKSYTIYEKLKRFKKGKRYDFT